uniref:Uncharacterized protein n=1 Tax=Globodera rostochiensis TaxID=31243 RepID=A0A914HYN4_GLORO
MTSSFISASIHLPTLLASIISVGRIALASAAVSAVAAWALGVEALARLDGVDPWGLTGPWATEDAQRPIWVLMVPYLRVPMPPEFMRQHRPLPSSARVVQQHSAVSLASEGNEDGEAMETNFRQQNFKLNNMLRRILL